MHCPVRWAVLFVGPGPFSSSLQGVYYFCHAVLSVVLHFSIRVFQSAVRLVLPYGWLPWPHFVGATGIGVVLRCYGFEDAGDPLDEKGSERWETAADYGGMFLDHRPDYDVDVVPYMKCQYGHETSEVKSYVYMLSRKSSQMLINTSAEPC